MLETGERLKVMDNATQITKHKMAQAIDHIQHLKNIIHAI